MATALIDIVLSTPGIESVLNVMIILSAFDGKVKLPINFDPFSRPETMLARMGPGSSVFTDVSITAKRISPVLMTPAFVDPKSAAVETMEAVGVTTAVLADAAV